MNAYEALKREYPMAREIKLDNDGIWNVHVGDDEYYEEIYSYTVKGSKLVYVGMMVVDEA